MKKLLLLLFILPAALFAQGAPDPGFGYYRNTAQSSTEVAIKAGATAAYGFTFINVNTTPVYLKFYNGTVASVVVGTTVPTAIIEVPAGNGTSPGEVILAPGTVPWLWVNGGMCIAAVTGIADNSTAAPSTAVYVEVQYK